MEQSVPFLDVLARRWVGSLFYREVLLVDTVLPSLYFRRVEFTEMAAAFQEVEQKENIVVDANALRPVSLEISSVDDNDDAGGNAPGGPRTPPASTSGIKRRSSWRDLAGSPPVNMPIARRLRPRRGVSGVATVTPTTSSSNPIDLSDDAPSERPVSEVSTPPPSNQVSLSSSPAGAGAEPSSSLPVAGLRENV